MCSPRNTASMPMRSDASSWSYVRCTAHRADERYSGDMPTGCYRLAGGMSAGCFPVACRPRVHALCAFVHCTELCAAPAGGCGVKMCASKRFGQQSHLRAST